MTSKRDEQSTPPNTPAAAPHRTFVKVPANYDSTRPLNEQPEVVEAMAGEIGKAMRAGGKKPK